MAFVDEITLHLKAGTGGDGVVRWRHEKGKEFSGPSGGNGGAGGDVYIRAIRDVALLSRYTHERRFEAKKGQDGMRDSMFGKGGEDITVDLPVGATVTNMMTHHEYTLEKEGDIFKVLEGGKGGLGNEMFKSSTNVKPMECTPGREGEEADFHVELRLFADVGLIGFPNAGKSSLLNELTRARAKVANYQFTTLEPNLGDMEGFIVADIPGLIEGASEGRGLGHKFLRHITRTKMLCHCITLEHEDIVAEYKTIRSELSKYGRDLENKLEIVVLTKTDVIEDTALVEQAVQKIKKAASRAIAIYTVTILDDGAVKNLKDEMVKLLRKIEQGEIIVPNIRVRSDKVKKSSNKKSTKSKTSKKGSVAKVVKKSPKKTTKKTSKKSKTIPTKKKSVKKVVKKASKKVSSKKSTKRT